MVEVGDYIKIIQMNGEPQYSGKKGIVELIDDFGTNSWKLGRMCTY